MSFKYLPDVAIADIAFEATGKSINELFAETAKAITDIMVDPKTLKSGTKKTIRLRTNALETLLYDFLSDLIYMKDTSGFLCKSAKVVVSEKKGDPKFQLDAVLKGEKIDRKRHDLRNDLKAVTMHMFEIRKHGNKWKATVVVDI